jgi:hypothetical protein
MPQHISINMKKCLVSPLLLISKVRVMQNYALDMDFSSYVY